MGKGYLLAVATDKPRDSRTTHAEMARRLCSNRTAHKPFRYQEQL